MSHPAQERWMELAEGSSTASEAEALRSHLARCAECRVRYEAAAAAEALSRRVGAALGASPELDVPAEVEARVVARAREAAATAARRAPRHRRMAPWVAAVAAAAAVAAVVVVNGRRDGAGEELAVELQLAAGAEPRARGGAEEDPVAALRDAAARIREGAYRVVAARAERCAPAERARIAARDSAGRLRALLVRTEAGSELHLYGASGEELVARRADERQRITPSEPLPRGDAEAAMAQPACDVRRSR